MRKLLCLLVVPFFLLGCKDQQKIDQQIIENYISTHHLNAIAEPNGLYYVPVSNGTGQSAMSASEVTVEYTGYLANDSVFSASNIPYTTYLANVIQGWQEGIPLMSRGGRCTLLIPSALGYGAQSQPSLQAGWSAIPPNSVLIFDIYLINFQ